MLEIKEEYKLVKIKVNKVRHQDPAPIKTGSFSSAPGTSNHIRREPNEEYFGLQFKNYVTVEEDTPEIRNKVENNNLDLRIVDEFSVGYVKSERHQKVEDKQEDKQEETDKTVETTEQEAN